MANINLSSEKSKLNQIQLPVPKPEDLPPFYQWEGWTRAQNEQIGVHWIAWLHYRHPSFPPMANQMGITLEAAAALKPKQLLKTVKDMLDQAIHDNEVSIAALGWKPKTGELPTSAVQIG
jgi:hypothetical protein